MSLRMPLHGLDADGLIERIRDSVIGDDTVIAGPFGPRRLVYADYTASGRALSFVEDHIRSRVLPLYANTHTEASATGAHTTALREDARRIVHAAVNGSEDDAVVFCGSGATGAIDKLVRVLALRRRERPVVFVGPYEHHSNELPWRESIAHVVPIREHPGGGVDLDHLENELERHGTRPLMIGSFSAASNVTGILTDVDAVSALLHRHGALACWDYASAGPYVPIDMTGKDAVFLSPHKFPGGPGTPGVLVAKRALFRNRVPSMPGGGTILFVSPRGQSYHPDPAIREEAGTPAIVESIRAGLVFALKEQVGAEEIRRREAELARRALDSWGANANIELLGNPRAERLPIVSFGLRHEGGLLHSNFVAAVLSDLFGIQARSGCFCAGPYIHRAYPIDDAWSARMDAECSRGHLGAKLAFVRVSFSYFISEAAFDYVLRAVHLLADEGWKLLPLYRFDPDSGLWQHRAGPRRDDGAPSRAPESVLATQLELAEEIVRSPAPAGPVDDPPLSPQFERIRWFPLPGEALARLAGTIALSLCVLLALTSPATAALRRIGPPRSSWSVSKIEQGVGKVLVKQDLQLGGQLNKVFDLGPVAFNFPLNLVNDRAVGHVFSSADGGQSTVWAQAPTLNPFEPRSAKGGAVHLDQYQTYEKQPRAGGSSLRISISRLSLETQDANGPLTPSECPAAARCSPIRTIVRYHVRAHKVGESHDFYDFGGAVYTEGHQHAWFVGAATAPDSRGPFWGDAQFDVKGDVNGDRSGSRSQVRPVPGHTIAFNVPLRSVHFTERFTVHVSMDAEAINDRGHESAAQALIQDPQHVGPELTTRGLKPLGASRVTEPPLRPRPAARCPAGRSPHSGTMQLSSSAFTVGEASGTPMVLVTRTGGSRGATSVTVDTSGGSAQSGADFSATQTLVRFEGGDTSPRLVEIPIREDLATESPESFTASLSHPRCGRLGTRRDATVTILDDDAPPPAPAPEFTIGGTVDGLQGSGLVLSDLGTELPVAGNGSFTFPGTAAAGQTYEVNVKTQPHSPAQVCSVQQGTGHVSSANVTDVAVHCAAPDVPSGLDSTFGDGGRVSTPVGGGQGEGVVIQPSGAIVTAGWRTVGAGTDFALTRHDASGNLDRGFGTDGIATTDLSGARDQAHDAALTSDGGIVAVGETDAPGIQKQDFGIVCYLPDGTPDPGFDTDGVVTADFSGHGDVANAVAVQGDGKIVVAGFTTGFSAHTDFAVARYNPDGTPDPTFDDDGILTTDFGALSDDDARAIAIQPDGRIIVAGSAGEDVGLVRYLPNGTLDPTFGGLGLSRALPGSGGAHGVAVTPTGAIVIAGSAVGANLTRDFTLAGFRSDGTLNPGFGHLGSVTTDLGGGDDFAEDLALDDRGRIVLVGRASSPTILDMALARYNPQGTLDTGFAGDGILTADFHGRGEFGQDLALDAQGRIVAAGYTANGADTQFALMRANP